nr:hypothetical protein [Catellatospora coxensis]
MAPSPLTERVDGGIEPVQVRTGVRDDLLRDDHGLPGHGQDIGHRDEHPVSTCLQHRVRPDLVADDLRHPVEPEDDVAHGAQLGAGVGDDLVVEHGSVTGVDLVDDGAGLGQAVLTFDHDGVGADCVDGIRGQGGVARPGEHSPSGQRESAKRAAGRAVHHVLDLPDRVA